MTGTFKTPLDVKLIDEENNLWELQCPLVYESAVAGRVFAVPTEFVTNFASVPRLPLVFMLAGDKARCAAALHDYLYATAIVSRELADKIFLEAMEATGISSWRRYPMYLAVRQFGWLFYGKPKAHQTKE